MLKAISNRACRAALAWALLMTVCPVLPCTHAGEMNSIKAFWLTELPSDYGDVEKLFLSYREAGADTVIVGPLSTAGPLKIKGLSHVIFLAHKHRLKFFVTVLTRRDRELLRSHPQWEDRRYDLRSGSLKSDDAIDLFRTDVLECLVGIFREISSYTVDGIFLEGDFTYGDTDGMSRELYAAYKKLNAKEPDPKKLFAKVKKTGGSYHVDIYGAEYEKVIRMKQKRLGEVFRALKDASREVNKDVKFGVPLRFYGYENILETLSDYTRTVRAFRRAEPDFYWAVITQREKKGLGYKKGMESVARAAKIIETAVEDKDKAVIVLSMMNKSGRLVATTEIEEMTNMARQGGIRTVIYRVRKGLPLPVTVTRKLFNPAIE